MITKTTSVKYNTQKKRGRPRKEGVLREANGRISRAKKPAAYVALAARARHTGLDLARASDPRAATYIGRLNMAGSHEGLSRDQYEAALKFLEVRNDYQRSLLSPGAYYESSGQNSHTGDGNMADYTQWASRVRRRYDQAMKALQEAQFDNSSENLYAALQYVVINGQELPHLLGATRIALNALARHFMRQQPRRARSRAERYNISLGGMLSIAADFKQG
ncbi:MAG: Hypothetical protein BHV28_16360 [Candidatus Tokpelaia hoelldobleri]|uniref:Uncharacterized protein n=1 Tax=Candidatus Tokpelaia hoelldobleri TaxID=1902579 RepID=A0A1U9JWR7_9HYPH|nr:MAG: Hypothetical protein BHV28_16360 [Candidatus Tokpelaia hoelldoblerii]